MKRVFLPSLVAMLAAIVLPSAAHAITFTPPADAPNGGNGFVRILDVINNGGINDQDQARASLTSGLGTRTLGTAAVVNHVGNADDGSGLEGHFGGNLVLPNGAVDNRAVIFRAPVIIPTTGFYTFNVASDDGFTLAFDNGAAAFSTQYNGALDTYNGTGNGALTFFGGRGTGDTGGSIFLTQGSHQMDLTFHDGCCGDDVELSAAAGQHGGFNFNFTLVGSAPTTTTRVQPTVVGPINLEVRRGSNAGNGGIAGALNAINNDIGAGFFGVTSVINHKDPEAGVCCGGFDNGAMQILPGDQGGVDDQDYAAQWRGTLNMPVAGDVFFRIQTDDGFQFQIDGAVWQGLGGQITSIVGDTLNADVYTGNSEVTAIATLLAGNHNFVFTGFEGGGGSYWEVWMGGDPGTPGAVLLGQGQGQVSLFTTAPLQFGELVPEPTTAVLGLLALAGLARRRRHQA